MSRHQIELASDERIVEERINGASGMASATSACCVLPPALRLSTPTAEELAAMCKAIGHPVRLQIVDLLSRYGGEVCVCDIESQFDLTQPTISHHLKTLRSAGVIDCEERGLWVYYFIKSGQIERLRNLLGDWLSQQAT